jgi:threonyl-tRNA synthetase
MKRFSDNKNNGKEISTADHRLLGQRLDLYSITEEVGIGLVLWHPKGTVIRRIIRDFWEEEHLRNGYQLVCTPHIAREELWKTSGHLDYYRENMYVFEKDGEKYVVKPMNCPFHIQIFKSKQRSYRDLPIRYAEWGTVYRYERSGTLNGLLRARGFTQDDAHIFCAAEQVEDEVLRLLDFTEHMLNKFGFKDYRTKLSTRDPKQPEKYMGSEREWSRAEFALAKAMEKKGIEYREMPGEAVFYGPKIDIDVVDAAGREWQCTTIQFDFNLPRRFNVSYVGSGGRKRGVVMIHRALLGAVERFFAILIEHYHGNLPVWLAPTQVKVLPVSSDYLGYAETVQRKLMSQGIRAELDSAASTISYRIRQAEVQKIPYMIVCGKREAELKQVTLRKHGLGNVGLTSLKDFVKCVKESKYDGRSDLQ